MSKRTTDPSRVTVENVNVPGYTVQVDVAKYEAMRKALLADLPKKAPGFTQAEIRQAVLKHLPEDLFPVAQGGLVGECAVGSEAKGIVDREATKPLRWHVRKATKGKW